MEFRHEISKTGKIMFYRYEPGEKRAKVNKKIAVADNGEIQQFIDDLTEEEEREIIRITSEQGQKQRVERVVDGLLQLKNEDADLLALHLKSLNLKEGIVKPFGLLLPMPEDIYDEVGYEAPKKKTPQKIETIEDDKSRDRILILCEGETEEVYLRSIANHLGLSQRVTVKVNKICNSPLGCVTECAKEVCLDDATDKRLIGAWAVFDRDKHPNYQEAFTFAEKFPRVHIAWSNPCFEVWFLMHFAKLPASMNRTEEIVSFVETSRASESGYVTLIQQIKRVEKVYSPTLCLKNLRRYWSSYEKNGKNYLEETGSKIGFALEEKKFYTTDPNNIGSNVGSLIRCLLDMASKTVEEGFGQFTQTAKDVKSMTPEELMEEVEKGEGNNLTEELLTETINYMQALKDCKVLNLSPNVSRKLDRLQEKLKVLNSTTGQGK